MISTNETKIDKQSDTSLLITRNFNSPQEKVWRAWTEKDLLDQWWAPRPWKAETKIMDFSIGGLWLYAMSGPNGEKAWCRVDFHAIEPKKSFTSDASFCDEEGNIDKSFPKMHWRVKFSSATGDTTTTVTVNLSFDSAADLEKIVAMGFKEGFTMAQGNLDELLAAL